MDMESSVPPPRDPSWVGLALVPVAVVVVLAGIWVAGGVVTDNFRLSMALTGLWFAAVVATAAVVWRGLPAFRAAAVAGVVAFLVAGGYLGYTSNVDRTVDEVVAAGPVALAGSFRALAHETTGVARVVRDDGTAVVTLTGFRTDPGPDLYVYAVPGRTAGDDVDGGISLGRLKGNVGDQQYTLDPALETADGLTVVVWCRAFSVAFGAATLAPPAA